MGLHGVFHRHPWIDRVLAEHDLADEDVFSLAVTRAEAYGWSSTHLGGAPLGGSRWGPTPPVRTGPRTGTSVNWPEYKWPWKKKCAVSAFPCYRWPRPSTTQCITVIAVAARDSAGLSTRAPDVAETTSRTSSTAPTRLTLHQKKRRTSVTRSPVTHTPHTIRTHRTAGQQPVATGSRMATHST